MSLRETGSQIVIDTIENAFRVAGVELFGGGFHIDSSIGYDFGDYEGIKGDLDAVIPLLHIGRHVLFAQPGAVFWTGIEKEERIDGNFGLVYRNELTKDLVGGVSFFYDQDFQIGHSRISGGIDLQSHALLLGANYYHVLSEVEDGREGFVEEAVDGMDLRMAIEKDIVRAEASVGYWDYTGEESGGQEDPQSGWQTSIGIDFGIRVMPGVFVEAGWEKHKDDLVLDERIFAGLAFRFSLPDLKGASYGDGSMSANLYKIVDREKRILYEERVAGPTVSIALPDGVSANVAEGGTVTAAIQLSEVLLEDVTINLVGGGTAEYGSSNDYTVSVGGTLCTGVTEDDCQVTIAAGETIANVTISIVEGEHNELDENIILSMVIDSAGDTGLILGNSSLSFTIPADPPLPTVSLTAESTSISEGETATLTISLSETVTEDVVINLLEGEADGDADYGTSADWHLNVGGTDCATASGTDCQITIMANQMSATATVSVNNDIATETSPETFTVSIGIASAGSTGFVLASQSSLNFTTEDVVPPTVSLNYSGNASIPADTSSNYPRMRVDLSRSFGRDVTIKLVVSGTAMYDSETTPSGTYRVETRVLPAGEMPPTTFNINDGTICAQTVARSTGCDITIQSGQSVVDIALFSRGALTSGHDITLTLSVASASSSLVLPGSPLTHTLTVQ